MTTPDRPKLHSVDEFKAEAARKGGRILPVRKEIAGVTVKADESGKMDFVISTASPDRSHDTVSVEGWNHENFDKNPVVLWAHDYSQRPVGKSGPLASENGRFMAKGVEFTPRDVYEFGWSVGEMYRQGFLNAVSVGFRPLKYNLNTETGGVDFEKQELLEFSAVPVPANPEALVAAKSAGIPLGGLVEWAERILDSQDKAAPVAREYVEQLRASAKGSISVQVPAAVKADEPEADEEEGDVLGEEMVAELKKLRRSLVRNTKALSVFSREVHEVAKQLVESAKKAPLPPTKTPASTPGPQPEQKRVARADLGKAVEEALAKQLEALKGRTE